MLSNLWELLYFVKTQTSPTVGHLEENFFNNCTSLAWRCCTWSILKQAERIPLRPLLVKTNKRLKKIYPMKCLCVWHFNANQPTNNWNVFEHFSWLWYIERSFVNTDLTLSQRLDPFIETSQDCPLYTYLKIFHFKRISCFSPTRPLQKRI